MIAAKWTVKNNATEAEVLIYDEIGEDWSGDGISAKAFVSDLDGLSPTVETITVRLNSPGGDVFEGLAIYRALLRNSAMVMVEIDACAASIASVIAMAGDTIRMADTASLMIHDPYSFAVGNAADMREMADLLDHVARNIVVAYTSRTGVEAEPIRAAMQAETWYSADEALAAGLVDEVAGSSVAIAAKIAAGRFRNTPKSLLGDAKMPNKQPIRHRLESARRALRIAGLDA